MGAALSQLLADHDVAVLVSEYERFSLSLAEAMASGLPGVVMECGGVVTD